MNRFLFTSFLTIFICDLVLSSSVDADDTDRLKFFETKIRPVLVEHCYSCHSAEADEIEGGLALDSREGVRAGGESGASVVPKSLDKSLILKAIGYDDSFYEMPPDGKLPNYILKDFEKWIADGAIDPREQKGVANKDAKPDPMKNIEDGRQFWSFVPPKTPPLPQIGKSDWATSPIDFYVQAKRVENGLSRAGPATKQELIRRATYDLTGLPPTSNEVANFLNDDSLDAFETVVDRLLASKRYGEKYGRHWLDVVRYADSNGLDENLAYANAFRFRDYIVRAFNEDLPFDQLIREHLAGDLISRDSIKPDAMVADQSRSIDRLIATGFLSIGPKMLACDDGRKMEMDIIDEQVDTTSRAFMGLTMGCARCHDHKFDPILAKDYYSMASIFKSTKTMENFNVVAVWHEHELKTKQKQLEIDKFQKELAVFTDKMNSEVEKRRVDFLARHRGLATEYLMAATEKIEGDPLQFINGTSSIGEHLMTLPNEELAKNSGVRLFEAEGFTRGTIQKNTDSYGKGIGTLIHAGYAEYEIEIVEAGKYQLESRYAALDSRPVQFSLNGKKIKTDGAREVTGGWNPEHQKWHIEGVFKFVAGKNLLRIERSSAFPHLDKFAIGKVNSNKSDAGAVSSIDFSVLDKNILDGVVSFLRVQTKIEHSFWKTWMEQKELRGTLLPAVRIGFANALKSEQATTFRELLFEDAGPFKKINGIDAKKLSKRLGGEDEKRIVALQKEKTELEKRKPVFPKAMGVREGKIEDLKVHIRGNYLTLGEKVNRDVPVVFEADEDVTVAAKSSGRLELANWLSSPKHPQTARVIANRIWLWHFGRGIVSTPDNFGRLGAAPSNQPLLDWLSCRLVELDWSMKKLHREIMLSATYQMSSAFNEADGASDPANEFLWRFNRRRLSAEEVRDSILHLSSSLDEKMFGQLLPDKNRGYVTGTGSKQGSYDFPRRSVYLPVLRSAVYPVLQAFDFPDPAVQSGSRQSSTIAPQALFMMNGDIVLRGTRRLAETLVGNDSLDDFGRLEIVFQKAYARNPTTDEAAKILAYLEKIKLQFASNGEASKEYDIMAWRSVCRILVAASEFIYID